MVLLWNLSNIIIIIIITNIIIVIIIIQRYYIPVVPTLLLNGSQGIGTGWSTSIPPYNIQEVINHVYMRLRGLTPKTELRPWVRGFQGKIIKDGDNFISRG
jgi:DNA topoisomerase-2